MVKDQGSSCQGLDLSGRQVSTDIFLVRFFFLMWTIFRVSIELVTILFLFLVFGFLAAGHMGD